MEKNSSHARRARKVYRLKGGDLHGTPRRAGSEDADVNAEDRHEHRDQAEDGEFTHKANADEDAHHDEEGQNCAVDPRIVE